MPDYSRNIDIGKVTADPVEVNVTATVEDEVVVEALEVLDEMKTELRKIRATGEIVIDQKVELQEGD